MRYTTPVTFGHVRAGTVFATMFDAVGEFVKATDVNDGTVCDIAIDRDGRRRPFADASVVFVALDALNDREFAVVLVDTRGLTVAESVSASTHHEALCRVLDGAVGRMFRGRRYAVATVCDSAHGDDADLAVRVFDMRRPVHRCDECITCPECYGRAGHFRCAATCPHSPDVVLDTINRVDKAVGR